MIRVSVAVAIILAIVIAIFFSPIFKIKNIEFNAQSCLTDQKQLEKYQVFDQNILFYKSSNLSDKLKGDFSCIDQLKITKSFPSKLKVEIVAQKPVAKIDGTDLVIAKDADVDHASGQNNLPSIFLPQNTQLAAGQKVKDGQILFAVNLLAILQKTDFTPQNLRFLPGADIAVYDTSGTVALFTMNKEANSQVDSLQAILAHSKIDEAKIAKIDLRFDNPVIFAR